jgi:hypothetical protein
VACNDPLTAVTLARLFSPSPELRALVLQLTRVLGLALAFVLAGVFVGPWSAPPTPREEDPQVLASAAHEVLATECQETPEGTDPEDDQDLIVLHAPAQPLAYSQYRDILRTHDALGPPTHCPDVETPPPRA